METEIADDPLDRLADELRAEMLADARAGDDGDPSRSAMARIHASVDQRGAALSVATRADLTDRLLRRALGLGPLAELMADPGVDEILVRGTAPIWIERGGRLEPTLLQFENEADLRAVIERLLMPAGRRVDESEPLCDARLPDGSRVNVVLPPLAVDGPVLTIRRFRPRGLDPGDLVRLGTWSAQLADLLEGAVRTRRCILVSGGTGSGKTTTLGALSAFLEPCERVITIEDTAELRLRQEHVVRLESRPASVDGRGAVTIRDLVRNALRMRPDRIIVGEVRGAEALDMVQAMATGHDGSMSTVHAGSCAQALRRLELLILMAGAGLPHEAIREQVHGAIDLVVHQVRRPDGARVVTAVDEITRAAGTFGTRPAYRRHEDGSIPSRCTDSSIDGFPCSP